MTLELVLTILQVVSGLIVSIIILLQSGKSAGLSGAIAGGADTFFLQGQIQDTGSEAREGNQMDCSGICSSYTCSAYHLINNDYT